MPLNEKFSLTRTNTPRKLQTISAVQNRSNNGGGGENERFWGRGTTVTNPGDHQTYFEHHYYVFWIPVSTQPTTSSMYDSI